MVAAEEGEKPKEEQNKGQKEEEKRAAQHQK